MYSITDGSDLTDHRGWIARTTFSDPYQGSVTIDASPNNAFVVQGSSTAYPLAGESANLMGYQSGWTTGTVTNTCIPTPIGNSGNHVHFSGTPYLLCQFITSATSRPGDSSEPVFRQLGTQNGEGREYVHLLGIAWAGTGPGATPTGFSPMAGVNADFLLLSSGITWGY